MKTQADLLNFRVAELLTFRLPKTSKKLSFGNAIAVSTPKYRKELQGNKSGWKRRLERRRFEGRHRG
jgi:hypothetical protein